MADDKKIEIIIDAVTVGIKKGIDEAVAKIKELEVAADKAGKATSTAMADAGKNIELTTVPAAGRLAGALMDLVNPAGLAATAAASLGAALVAYATSGGEKIATLSETMDRHAESIARVAAKYPDLMKGLDAVAKESNAVLATRLQGDLQNYEKNLVASVESFTRQVMTLFPKAGTAIDEFSIQFGAIPEQFGVAKSAFAAFQPAINNLVSGLNSGKIDLETFKNEVSRLKEEAGSNYQIVELANKLLDLVKDSDKAAAGISRVTAQLRQLQEQARITAGAEFSSAIKALDAISPTKVDDYTLAQQRLTKELQNQKLTLEERDQIIARGEAAMQRALDAAKKPKPTTAPAEDDGMTAQMQRRMQFIMDSTLTEEQLLVARYERNRLLLQEAFAIELADSALHGEAKAALKAQQDATIEALDAKHQQNMQRMQAAADARTLGNMASTFGSIASIIESGGKKGSTAAKAFYIAQALMSTFSAATQAMADPTLITPFQKFAAYAAIAAKGLSAVASIRSVNPSGGGGGGAAAAGAGATTAAAPAPTTTFQFTMTNDPMGFGEKFARQFIDQLNSTQRNGGQIRGVIA